MIVNKKLMAKARFDKKKIGELTVKQFRTLMQECFDADRLELKIRENEEFTRIQQVRINLLANRILEGSGNRL